MIIFVIFFVFVLQEMRKFSLCQEMRICVVDNFQGEENDIILLSLVRSNDAGQVGFLKTDNRICVALSRAKQGFYVVGNLDQLSASSSTWKKMEDVLEGSSSVGESLPLMCQNHPETLMEVSEALDFAKFTPEGGCTKKCGKTLEVCRHVCPRLCHHDDGNHQLTICADECNRTCERGHICQAKCKDKCPPCPIKVTKALPCGHSLDLLCGDTSNRCTIVVERELPGCSHVVQGPCFKPIEDIVCNYPCDTKVKCGHVCMNTCHAYEDPDHKLYMCHDPCNLRCLEDHPCPLKCFEPCPPCKEIVSRDIDCGHLAKMECHVREYKCPKQVSKTVPLCGHENKMKCHQSAEEFRCKHGCDTRLDCGHQCTSLCHVDDDPEHLDYVCKRPCPRLKKNCTMAHRCPKECHQECKNCDTLVVKVIPECGHQSKVSFLMDVFCFLVKLVVIWLDMLSGLLAGYNCSI